MTARPLAAAAAATGFLLLASCGVTEPHGTVTEKEHEPEHRTWRTEPKTKQECTTRKTSNGTSTSCRTVPDGTRRVLDVKPECWELELDSGDEVCVSEDTWRATSVGDFY
ncbi:hypothetical protein [Streptomyces chartreusis]|uniref:hypothetical protein n=1 Tax=Streptomyces chartreusis TaxID=1969 RepID=UPI003819BACB